MIFDPQRFEQFCKRLQIDTKERGRIPFCWLGTQRYFVNEISQGLAADIHTFVVLKGRQIGISTISLAFDLYWMSKYPGLQGAVVTDTDENRELFRSYVEQYLASLPRAVRAPISRRGRSNDTTHTPTSRPDTTSGINAHDCFPLGLSSCCRTNSG